MALAAQTRADLNASLQGLARVADVFPSAPAVQHPVHEGMQNLAAGFLHLATLPTMFLAPPSPGPWPRRGVASPPRHRAPCVSSSAP